MYYVDMYVCMYMWERRWRGKGLLNFNNNVPETSK
jgi:hypothetical protein